MSELSELAAQGAAIVERKDRLIMDLAAHFASDRNELEKLNWVCGQVASMEPTQLASFDSQTMELIHFAAGVTLTRIMQEAVNILADAERSRDNS